MGHKKVATTLGYVKQNKEEALNIVKNTMLSKRSIPPQPIEELKSDLGRGMQLSYREHERI